MAVIDYIQPKQSKPAATTLTDLWTVPSAHEFVASTMLICNKSGSNTTFRVAISVNGDAIEDKHYIFYDQVLEGNETFEITTGLTAIGADIFRVESANGECMFTLMGKTIS